MKQFKIVLAMVAGALGLSALLVWQGARPASGGQPTSQPDLPWQIQTQPGGGSQVFGLKLTPGGQGSSTLGEARARWGDTMQVAVIAAPGEAGTLEAYVDPVNAGFVTGKLVLTAKLDAAAIQGLRERTIKAEFMESTTRKFLLAPADLPQALAAPIVAMGFIPSASLDEATVLARFGKPAQRVVANAHLTHLLYPEQGLDIALDTQGKELLQYVAPSEFTSRLQAPLQAAASAVAPASQAAAAASGTQP